ncbi:MAG TPA: ABC transporter permease, partial [Cyclobacteriaceae bacterium]|nr:ABC transporter permease [Cyclobacteriaceae bacterium]
MLRNFFTIAIRSLLRKPGYSFLNITGLAVGMTVSMMIGLWSYDELTFNHYHANYERLAIINLNQTTNHQVSTHQGSPLPMAEELKTNFKSDFTRVVTMWWESDHTLTMGEEKTSRNGTFMDADGLALFSFRMLKGNLHSLDDPSSIVLSASTSRALFGDDDPINKVIRFDGKFDLRVSGVFEDLPKNSDFTNVHFAGSWNYWVEHNPWLKSFEQDWNYQVRIYAEISPATTFDKATDKIKNIKQKHIAEQQAKTEQPELFLEPMDRWHLYSEFKDGKSAGGRIQFVRLFSTIGLFVLLLACINFMNLSTAQSERRAREVGIRKSVGSARVQLITQFLSESLLVVSFSWLLALVLVTTLLPSFNVLAGKDIALPLGNPFFWMAGIFFVMITSLLAGSYPALYLSSFQPVKVLKGKFHAGRFTNYPRRALVVFQFIVSITLIIGTIIVWQQVNYA